jgi:hypothetical protein
MKRRLAFRPQVEGEVTDAFDWYESCQPGVGDEFLRSLKSLYEIVRQAPERFPVVKGTVRRATMKRFP